MQNYTATHETSNSAIERWKKSCRTKAQHQTISDFLEARTLPAPPQSFKSFVTKRAQQALLSLSSASKLAKELLDLIVIFGEGANETLAQALSIEPIECASETPRELPAPTMLELLGSDIHPDLFSYILTLPAATTAQQFVDGCTNPAYLLIAMDAADLDWESTARVTQAIEKLSDADACKYLRDTCYTNVIVKTLNAMMK